MLLEFLQGVSEVVQKYYAEQYYRTFKKQPQHSIKGLLSISDLSNWPALRGTLHQLNQSIKDDCNYKNRVPHLFAMIELANLLYLHWQNPIQTNEPTLAEHLNYFLEQSISHYQDTHPYYIKLPVHTDSLDLTYINGLVCNDESTISEQHEIILKLNSFRASYYGLSSGISTLGTIFKLHFLNRLSLSTEYPSPQPKAVIDALLEDTKTLPRTNYQAALSAEEEITQLNLQLVESQKQNESLQQVISSLKAQFLKSENERIQQESQLKSLTQECELLTTKLASRLPPLNFFTTPRVHQNRGETATSKYLIF